jgi:N-acetylneuraminic acid mutarotase
MLLERRTMHQHRAPFSRTALRAPAASARRASTPADPFEEAMKMSWTATTLGRRLTVFALLAAGGCSGSSDVSVMTNDANTLDTGSTADAGNTAETGNTPDTGNTADTGNMLDMGNRADTGNTADTGGTADAGNMADTGGAIDSGSRPSDAAADVGAADRTMDAAAPDGPGGWTVLPPLAGGPRQETGVAALDGKIYVVGGFNGAGVVVATVEAYDPALRTWSTVAPFPRVLHHANTAAVAGKLYVVGALADGTFRAIGDVYVYDPASNTWSMKTPLPLGQERGAGGVAVIGTKIYVAGGFRNGNGVADFSSYDTASDMHASLPPLAQASDHLVGGAVNGIVYAIGGRFGGITGLLGRVVAFDPATNSWSEKAPMITPRGGAAAAVVRDRIVVAGGEGNAAVPSGVFSQVEVFVPGTNSWYSLPNMRTPRHGTGGASIGNTFYVPGGAAVQAFGASAEVESIDF